jgi:hypothetical protein
LQTLHFVQGDQIGLSNSPLNLVITVVSFGLGVFILIFAQFPGMAVIVRTL